MQHQEGMAMAAQLERILSSGRLPAVFPSLPKPLQSHINNYFKSLRLPCPSCLSTDHVQFRYLNNKRTSLTLQARYVCHSPICSPPDDLVDPSEKHHRRLSRQSSSCSNTSVGSSSTITTAAVRATRKIRTKRSAIGGSGKRKVYHFTFNTSRLSRKQQQLLVAPKSANNNSTLRRTGSNNSSSSDNNSRTFRRRRSKKNGQRIAGNYSEIDVPMMLTWPTKTETAPEMPNDYNHVGGLVQHYGDRGCFLPYYDNGGGGGGSAPYYDGCGNSGGLDAYFDGCSVPYNYDGNVSGYSVPYYDRGDSGVSVLPYDDGGGSGGSSVPNNDAGGVSIDSALYYDRGGNNAPIQYHNNINGAIAASKSTSSSYSSVVLDEVLPQLPYLDRYNPQPPPPQMILAHNHGNPPPSSSTLDMSDFGFGTLICHEPCGGSATLTYAAVGNATDSHAPVIEVNDMFDLDELLNNPDPTNMGLMQELDGVSGGAPVDRRPNPHSFGNVNVRPDSGQVMDAIIEAAAAAGAAGNPRHSPPESAATLNSVNCAPANSAPFLQSRQPSSVGRLHPVDDVCMPSCVAGVSGQLETNTDLEDHNSMARMSAADLKYSDVNMSVGGNDFDESFMSGIFELDQELLEPLELGLSGSEVDGMMSWEPAILLGKIAVPHEELFGPGGIWPIQCLGN